MIELVFRVLVMTDLLFVVLSIFSPLRPKYDFTGIAPAIKKKLVILFAVSVALYAVAFIGLLMLQDWGYFLYLVVLLILLVVTFSFSKTFLPLSKLDILAWIIVIFIVGLPLFNNELNAVFFGV